MGLLGLLIPVLDLFITEEIDSIASSCPIILLRNILSKFRREDFSVSNIFVVGIPVQLDKIIAISFSVTLLLFRIILFVFLVYLFFVLFQELLNVLICQLIIISLSFSRLQFHLPI